MLSRHRLFVAVCGALAALCIAHAAAAVAAPAPTGIGWTVIDRYGGDPDGDGKLDGAGPLNPRALDVFAVRVLPTRAVCQELERAAWRVDGSPVRPVLEPGESCGAVVRVRGEGEHKVKVLARNRAEVARVTVDDELIVALGDSVASGEGNPEGRDHHWLERSCHRSAAAGFEQAARQLGEVDRRHSVTFVSLACSGARIDKGLLGPYAGIAPEKGVELAPQVERLKTIAEARARGEDDGPGVDAVLLSIGANDVRFSDVAKRCAAWIDDCSKEVKEGVEQRLGTLEGGYDELGEALAEAAPDAPVLISEYFDPTHGENGHFCPGPLATSRDESRWAYEHLLRPLNLEVEAAAERNGWQRVGGIAADFRQHGYCAAKKPWVRTLPVALELEDPAGTLHPNEEGHKAIAKRVARPLAAELDFQTPADPPEADEGGGLPNIPPWALVVVLLLLVWPAARALFIARPTWPEDPAGVKPAPPQIKGRRVQLSLRHLLLIAAGILIALGAMLVLAGLAGRAILWLRFWSAHLPADQAVRAASGSELVSTGAAALAIFAGLGLLAAALAWLLDAKGREVRATRRGLIAIGLAELLAAVWIGDFRQEQQLQLLLGLLAAALFLHYLVDRGLEWRRAQRQRWSRSGGTASPLKQAWEGLKARGKEFVNRDESALLRLWKLVPFALLAGALYLSTWTDGADRRLALIAYVLAAMAFALPGGIAARGVRWGKLDDAGKAALTLPRIALASTGFALVVIFLLREEPWLAGVAAVAVLLGLLCLAVAAASGERFGPYGLAVLVSVPLFAGAAAFLHGLDSPELQPVAAILADGEAVCGAYVGESDGQLWMARIILDDDAGDHRPQRGSIEPLETDAIAARSLGSLEPVDLVDLRARQLRDELLEERDDSDPVKRTPSCSPTPAMKASIAGTRGRPSPDPDLELAEEFQPELVVDRHDRFWPVPVETLFSIRDRRSTICRQVAAGDCLRLGTPGEFPWIGGQGESLEYPAADNDIDEQHDQMVAALGSADPEASATEYYLVHRTPGGPISIQYWFFYPFNYQPDGEHFVPGGFHEGDFEGIGVLLSASGQPRYVWMNRHDEEGRAFPWSDEALSRPDGHPRVFAARGSHATYENCEGQVRPFEITGVIDDHPTCDQGRQLHLMPEVTPLVDLSRVGWACWQGLFGHRKGGVGVYETLPSLINDAPKSPLWQQKFGGVEKQPCRGLSDPGGRDGPGEEVLEEGSGVPAHLREEASPLENAIDDCKDWEKPATSGIYMVACSQGGLKRYVKSGLEDPGAGVRIEARGSAAPPPDPLPVPAVRRNRHGAYLSDWRISTRRQATVTVYASCPSKEGVIAARFENVVLEPDEPLTLRDQGPGGTWLLTAPDGTTPWEAVPYANRAKRGVLVPRAPRPGKYLPCEAVDG